MKKLTLQYLKLTNFKGQNFALSLESKNASIYGDNGTGKTTLYDGLCWLLFDKDSKFDAKFEIKNKDANGDVIHGLSHEVEASFNFDGKSVTLKKIYAEQWTKPRGQQTKVLSGHNTEYYVDGVPVKANDYKQRIASIATEEQFKLLTSPLYFSSVMSWKDRRSMLLSLCGDVPDSLVLANVPELLPLEKILAERTIDDHRKVVADSLKKAKKSMTDIEPAVVEVMRSLSSANGINHLAEIERINKLSAEQEMIRQTITDLKNGGGVAELRKDLAAEQTNLLQAQNEYNRLVGEEEQRRRQRRHDIEFNIANLKTSIAACKSRISTNSEAIKTAGKTIESLKAEWWEVDAEQKELVVDICDKCGNKIPPEMFDDIVSARNEKCSIKKASIDEKGKACRAAIHSAESKAREEENSIAKLEAKIKELDKELALELPAIDSIKEVAEAISTINLFKGCVAAIQEKINASCESDIDTDAIARAEVRSSEIQSQILESQAKIATVEAAQKQEARAKELDTEKKKLAGEVERLEGENYLLDQFVTVKVRMLEDRINSMFEMARFKMFEVQVNGETAECCKVLYNGIPFESSLNNGSRIRVGLDVIRTISQRQGLVLPVMIDNNESITHVPKMECQVIGMFVSEADKTLRVEVAV